MNERSEQASSQDARSQNTDLEDKNANKKGWLEKIGQALIGSLDSPQQILELLKDAEKRNILGIDALAMIEGVLEVSEMQVRDIMIPRSHMTVLEIDAPIKETLQIIVDSAHSRFPVIGDNRDDIEGILLAKDILSFCLSGDEEHLEIRDLLRPAVIIPESKRLNVLLKDFRNYRNHMAIIVDEYGGVSGLVTIEDVLEQIVGEIEDEHDIEEEKNIISRGDQTYTINSLTPVEEFNEFFDCEFSDREFDTIGGLVVKSFGHLPEHNEKTELSGFLFKVIKADHRRLYLLQVQVI